MKKEIVKKKYWDPLEDKELTDTGNINKVLATTLEESIRYRGISDVDVGVFCQVVLTHLQMHIFLKEFKKKLKLSLLVMIKNINPTSRN